ncbi:TonB-dependent receptor [Parahalioglobus pacificus]|uniref:TonB-dependent receptor n=1 Tax=Parahalioglobus pacificus TaxID=930806 RepID=A0A919CKI4_9GAMM|nr:TonB-dependent receptor [Halioglobus pacificus]GHD31003.1 TonB-dependent receptor [Halioglobus pacificus]
MKKIAVTLGLLLLFTASRAIAADAYLMVFLDEAPLRGVTVTLDDTPIGETDGNGRISAPLTAGEHVLGLSDDDLTFPVAFSSGADEDVEIVVTFTASTGDEPVVSVKRFAVGDVAATGFITGTVKNTVGAPVVGANIIAEGVDASTATDSDGVYVLELPRGAYDVRVVAPDYRSVDIPNVRVLADTGVTAGVTMYAAESDAVAVQLPSTQLEEVVVLGVFNPTDTSEGIERFATSITNAIDIEQLQRFGDSDVASALVRVAGVSVTDSKYATVRGLDGRYISATLNGLLMPSTDPQRRDVQLDLFPTNILGGIEIQKSYTPDQLATTTGGSIKINTKGLPDEKINQVSGDLAYNFDFTGDDVLAHRSSETEWLGFDNGLRDLPNRVVNATDGGQSLTICDPAIDPERCTSQLDAAALAVQFQDDYNVRDKQALPDVSAGWAYGDRLPAGDNEWGYYGALNYSRETDDRGDAELSNPLETQGEYRRTRETVALNGYFVTGLEYGLADEVLSKTSILRATDDVTRLESGIDGREGNAITSAILEYVERQFFSQAFTGHNELESDIGLHIFDWRAAYSRTDRYEPDRRQYSYFNNNLSTSAFERRWSDLVEDSIDLGFDYKLPIDWGDYNTTELQAGLLWSDKDRTVEQYRFGIRQGDFRDVDLGIDQDLEEILSYQNFVVDRFRLAANTTQTDSYDSTEEIQAYYLNANTDLGDAWFFGIGARFEDFSQTLDYPNEPDSSNELNFDDWYPAISATWRPLDDWQFRVGYSETASYPGLIERSESISFDPFTDDPIFGNPNLQVSTIENLDARLEYYFSDTESISLAVFAKEIDQPIERAIPDASGSAARGITFRNQDSADLFGIELDATKNLLDEDEYLLFLGGNVSYIDSEVELSEDSIRLEGESANGRVLQGQSEWLANVQLGFDHYPTEQKVTLLVNYFDDRIFRVARGTQNGPEIESGRIIVDITYSKMFGEALTLSAQINNLLNDEFEFVQNGNTIESFETGTTFQVGLTYQFF